MAYEVIPNRQGVYRILLECYPEGVFVNIFLVDSRLDPDQDYYQPDLPLAKRFCLEMYGVDEAAWYEVPDEVWH